MQRRTVLVVTAKLDKILAESFEVSQGIDRRWLRAGTLHQGKILAGALNVGDQACVSSERNCRDDDPRHSQDGDGGEQNAASKVAACTLTAGSERSAILQ